MFLFLTEIPGLTGQVVFPAVKDLDAPERRGRQIDYRRHYLIPGKIKRIEHQERNMFRRNLKVYVGRYVSEALPDNLCRYFAGSLETGPHILMDFIGTAAADRIMRVVLDQQFPGFPQ
jgi:hypothetical protein